MKIPERDKERNQTDVVASTLCDRFGPDYIGKQ
jgi:hypothetical protein